MRKIYYRGIDHPKYKYELTQAHVECLDFHGEYDAASTFVALSQDGTLCLDFGYACDGPSGPTIDTTSFMRGAFVHDALYQLMRLGLLSRSFRKQADQILRRICREDGMSWFRAWYVYRMVRLFAAGSAR